MEQFKRAQVTMLPTDIAKSDYHQLWLCNLNKLYNATAVKGVKSHEDTKFQELYILSDNEIKENDYCLNLETNTVFKMHKHGLPTSDRNKKIIATTDTSLKISKFSHYSQDLMKIAVYKNYPLPQPSQQFITKYIEEYNKGNIITDILVEYESIKKSTGLIHTDFGLANKTYYVDEIKINPKDNTITIKKLKDNWNREEHIINIKKFAEEFVANTNTAYKQKEIDDWISNNL